MDQVVSFLKSVFSSDVFENLFGFLPPDILNVIVFSLIFLVGLAIKRIIWG